MTLEDANYLLGLAEVDFANSLRSKTEQQKIMLVHSWAYGLHDIPADIVMMAFKQLITTCEWLPNVAKIRQQVYSLRVEAKAALAREASLREACRDFGVKEPVGMDSRRRRILTYIVESTQQMENQTGLSFEALLNDSYGVSIGSGEMGFVQLEGSTGEEQG